MCHQGHDVSYARFGSFFCDCGAQNGNEDRLGTLCRCLSPVSEHDAIQAHLVAQNRDELQEHGESTGVEASKLKSLDYAAVAARAFHSKSMASLKSVVDRITNAHWDKAMESFLEDELNRWKSEGPPFPSKKGRAASFEDVRKRMLSPVRGNHSSVQLTQTTFSPSTTSLRNSLNMRISVESSMERSRDSTRSVMAADSRGRVLVVETGQITMLSGGCIPGNEALDGSTLDRRTLPIIGSKSLGLRSVSGMSLSYDDERHVLLWGEEDACVLVLRNDATKVEAQIDLELNIDLPGREVDSCIRGQWLPSSETYVSLGTGSAIQMYSLFQIYATVEGTSPKISPELKISIQPPFTLSDYCLVQTDNRGPGPARSWRLFAILSDGSLHSIELCMWKPGLLKSQSSCIGGEHSRVLKSLDIFRSTSERQMTRLDYLRQSRILVCQPSNGCATALVLDSTGSIRRQFEILPALLVFGDQQVRGKYTHFTEVGLTRHNGTDYFRLVCVARGEDSQDHAILSIEYNESPDVRIGKIGTLAGENSIDGTTAFSVPCADSDEDEMNLSSPKSFVEKIVLCVAESDGRLSLYCDGGPLVPERRLVSFSRRITLRKFPLLAFEKFSSLSGAKVFYHVNGYRYAYLLVAILFDTVMLYLTSRTLQLFFRSLEYTAARQ